VKPFNEELATKTKSRNMRLSWILQIVVISLLVELAFSWNHDSFVGEQAQGKPDQNEGTAAISDTDFSVTGHFFYDVNFFAPPSNKPSPSPVKPRTPPTFVPASVPAGRFPHSSSTSKENHPVPTYNKPVSVPAPAPVPAGRFPDPVGQPVDYPVSKPTVTEKYPVPVYPDNDNVPVHPVSTSTSQVKVDTRIASYTAEWGTDVNNCQHISPNVFFNCHEGGVINVIESTAKNAICQNMSNDYVQCQQRDIQSDSSIVFTCSGIRKSHLLATANVSPSSALGCQKNGNAVTYMTLSRNCIDGLGRAYVDTSPDCGKGIRWVQGDTTFCASPAVCAIEQGCSELEIQSVQISNLNKDIQCSHVDPTQDMQFYPYETRTSLISSLNLVDWRVSGQARGCLWEPSPLLLRCEGGGNLKFVENYPFCFLIPEDNMGICQSFAPFSSQSEESVGLLVSCSGERDDQLILSVEIPSEPLDVQCQSEGQAIQSVMLSRGCGDYGTDGFNFINDRSFCDSQEHIFKVDDKHSYCFVGDSCEIDDGCYNMQLPALTARTGSSTLGHCLYTV
jgi:hypothetical protein